MFSRKPYIALIFSLLLSACSLVPLTPQMIPTAPAESTRQRATIVFPPTFTPTISPTAIPTLLPTPSLLAMDQSAALLPHFAEDALAYPEATSYEIEISVQFNPEDTLAQISGLARIRFTNPLEIDLPDLMLMLWPNDEQYQSTMSAGPVLVQDKLVVPDVRLDGLALRVDLPRSLPPNEMVDLTLPFTLEVGTMHSPSPKRLGITQGVLIAPTFYPLVPRIVNGEWDVETAPPNGDTTNSDIAFYTVKITASSDLKVVASGMEVSSRLVEAGKQQVTYVSGPMRDFAFAVGAFETQSRKAGDVVLNAWVLPEHTEDFDKVLDAAEIQMELLGERIGPYPYTELDIVDAPGAFGGIEYPGLVYIGTMGTSWVIEPTVHEVAHQWFYGLIGDDQIHEPWLDEGIATFATALYYEHAAGLGQGTGFLSNLRSVVRDYPEPDTPIGLGVGEYASPSDYTIFVYYKGALFLEALRNQLGDRVFFEFLSDFFQKYRYGFASAEDFQDRAESACGCDLDTLFDLWVYEGGNIFEP
ncbi:MAG: hypothetical protein GTO14_17625 [Anaerolineales bacterium]|nr:hypothetical protein [Anaerolineales bacterium]